MNFLARAWRYITRKPTKSILLMITFFVIGNLVILGLGISTAAENAKILTRMNMRAAISYEVDYEKFYEWVNTLEDEDAINQAYRSYPTVDEEMALKLAEDERVKAFNYNITNMAYSHGFDSVPVGNEENRGTSTYIDEEGNEQAYIEPNIAINANMFPNMIELAEGTYTVVEGRFYDQNDIDQAAPVCLITSEMAEVNGLKIGDAISYTMFGQWEKAELEQNGVDTEDIYQELEIIGIFNNANEVDPNSDRFRWMGPSESPKNIILMPLTSYGEYAKALMRKMYEEIYMKQNPEAFQDIDLDEQLEETTRPSRVIYLLNDPLDVDDFIRDHQNDIGEYLKLNANNDQFKKLARPLDTLSFFAGIIVWIVVINAIVIISLVTALTLKTREYEIGVLLSIGVSKIKIILQLFAELILIALLGFSLAAVSGSLMAGSVGRVVLDYQTNTEAQYGEVTDDGGYYWYGDGDYFTTVTQDDLLSKYEVKISPLLIGEIYLLGTAVVLVAIVVPSFMIMRLNPKQILLEQN
ncbi:MAG: ABC transporter permease [Solobacterium sp.]|nr:ABC transporter permease [Solobacterium sp.]